LAELTISIFTKTENRVLLVNKAELCLDLTKHAAFVVPSREAARAMLLDICEQKGASYVKNVFSIISETCPNLIRLAIDQKGACLTNGRGFFADVLQLRSLTSLQSVRMNSLAVFDLATSCPTITNIEVFGATDHALDCVDLNLPTVERIDASGLGKGVSGRCAARSCESSW